jgi:hypothetical protein
MSHFYVQTRKVHHAKADPHSKHTRIFLDWLTNAYQVPAELPQGWFKIVTTIHDHDAYWKEAQRFFYTEIAYALVSSKDDEENTALWSGVALMALDDVPLAVEGDEQLLMKTPYPTFLFSASCPSFGSSKYAWSIQSSL